MRKKAYVEVLRILAAFLVIVNHTNSSIFMGRTPDLTWGCSIAYFFLCKSAVPIFLMITGGLLLDKEDTPRQTLGRVLRVLVVFIPFSVFYYIFHQRRLGLPLSLRELFTSVLSGSHAYSLWYLWLYMGLLCMLPILQKLAKALSRRQLEYLLLLSLGLNGLLPLVPLFSSSMGSTFLYFFQGLLGPYLGLVLLGYYLEHYVTIGRKGCLLCAGGLLLLVAGLTAAALLLYYRDPSANLYLALDDRTLLPVTASAACIYLCVRYLFTQHAPGPRAERALCGLGRLTFGIYLLGDLVITLSMGIYGALSGVMPALPAMVLWELFIFACCALITALLRLIPPLRRVL